ncbi:M3 family metallopeptidase [Methylocystis parvus]|uniref:M3 family metallopeptidase n=1 Tax=Methylocystis parvus TaxID=134 RepID=A0A6B8M8X4_9HYPH|nr:M3 family metallopeptidase [Methylocystis parvus]QGM98079.1 M3 family metallopeptidase [Methylocystis parvus]WBK01602.1 M3 family metallopeptidase [Methylocystis parvus OBBP]
MSNPLMKPWAAPFGLPPFNEIRSEHFRPAFETALERHRAEIDEIANNAAAPGFANTIEALERSGKLLTDVGSVFWNLTATDTNQEMQEIERDMAAALSRHASDISMNPDLFRRVEALHAQRESLGLSPEQRRVLELTYKNFIRAGAKLNDADKARMKKILERLAGLSTQFSQNVLADESSWVLFLEESDLDGLSPDFRAAAARIAAERGAPGKYAVTLARSSAEIFLQSSTRRDLREIVFRAWASRGENGGETDNGPLIRDILQLREERAKLLGFETFADYKLDDTMAKTPAAVRDLLARVWTPALARAAEERAQIQALVDKEGANFSVAAHDWRYYAERVRKDLYDLDQASLRPYFQLDKIVAAAFSVAERLFGLQFVERKDLHLYHPDVRAFEALDKNGEHVALFLADYFARPSKRSGAWMSDFRTQHRLDGEVRPIIVNVMNFTKGADGAPTLLSLDDARTLFHEFGHGLHGMLSNVTYPLVAGTNVARDFVELPSQLYEHWLLEPAVLKEFALHAKTGEPMPDDLLARIAASRHFNQGFATVEFCASAHVDLDLHAQPAAEDFDAAAFERESLTRLSMPPEIIMRHRLPHFSHIFSGDGYSAGYYSYLWAETLDADAFEAFKETGDPFAPHVAERLKTHIYAAGGKQNAGDAYVAFRGRMPTVEPLLRQRGFAPTSAGR